MSSFFGNLIGRHKEQSANSEAAPLVQPRPIARYEMEPGVANESMRDLESPVHVSASEESKNILHNSNQAVASLKQSPDSIKQGSALDKTHHKDMLRGERTGHPNISERAEKATASSPKTTLLNQLSINDRHNKANQKPSLQHQESKSDGDDNDKSLLVNDELDLHVQSILHRLDAFKNNHNHSYRAFSDDIKPQGLSSPEDSNRSGSAQQLGILSNEMPADASLNVSDTKAKQDAQSVSEPEKANMQGLLTVPSWLTTMQSDINKRWQDVNAKIESTQPVVNVTIGRVEVRAVQNPEVQAPKPQKKPTGVMSLDDYLKERA